MESFGCSYCIDFATSLLSTGFRLNGQFHTAKSRSSNWTQASSSRSIWYYINVIDGAVKHDYAQHGSDLCATWDPFLDRNVNVDAPWLRTSLWYWRGWRMSTNDVHDMNIFILTAEPSGDAVNLLRSLTFPSG